MNDEQRDRAEGDHGSSGSSMQIVPGMAIGVAIGAVLGLALDDMGLGIGFGLAIGIAVGIALGWEKKRNRA